MVSVTLSLFVAGLSFLPSVIARPSNLRRDDIPKFPYDPNTTPYCTWWMDNDGSTNCQDIPDFWAISLDDFRRWVGLPLLLNYYRRTLTLIESVNYCLLWRL
jgi:hypothetical protein